MFRCIAIEVEMSLFGVFPEKTIVVVVDLDLFRYLLSSIGQGRVLGDPVDEGVISFVFEDFDSLVLVPGSERDVQYFVAGAGVVGNCKSYRQIFFRILVEVV